MGCPKCKSELSLKCERDMQTKQMVAWELSCTNCDWTESGEGDVSGRLMKPLGEPSRKETDSPIEYYSRITGYYQKISGWNPGKLQEWKDRHRYELNE